MTAALATLVFLVAAWAGTVAVLALLDDSGTKIIAALKGDSVLAREPLPPRQVTVRLSPRYPAPRAQPTRVAARLRAAA